jgi:hypothetical protein
MKICGLGFWALLRRARYRGPGRQDGWENVRDMYWRKLFNTQKFETANSKFAGEIVTDGKAVSILMRKPKRETAIEKPIDEKDFNVQWGLDPGMGDVFVAVNQWEESVSCSTKEFYEEARYTKAKQGIRGWQDRDPSVLEATCYMSTKKIASLKKLKVYIDFMTQRMDVMLKFSQCQSFRRQRLRRFIVMKGEIDWSREGSAWPLGSGIGVIGTSLGLSRRARLVR